MGIIARQSAKSSLVSMTSTLVGVLATLFIYTLDLDGYGFTQILLATSILLAPFASLGLSGVVIRFYPNFNQTTEQRASFFSFLMLVSALGSGLLALIYYSIGIPLLRHLSSPDNDFSLYVTYAGPIVWLTVLQLYAGLVEAYTMNFHRITVQTVATTLIPKFILPLIILLYIRLGWGYEELAAALILMRLLVLGLLLLYLYRLGELRFTSRIGAVLRSKQLRELLNYAAYGIIGAIGGKIALQIDTVSLGAYVTKEEVGVYQIIIFAAAVITIPYYALTRIASPILTEALQADNTDKVREIYQRSSLVLGFVGLVIFTGILVSLTDIFRITGKEAAFTGGVLTFVLIGVGKLFDLVGSVNGQIIAYSNLYRFNLVLVVILALLNLVLNYYFIAVLQLGIVGAAAASLIALGVFNLIKAGYIYRKMGIQPLLPELSYMIMLSLLLGWFWTVVPLEFGALLNVIIRSVLTGAVYLGYVFSTHHMPELREFIIATLKKVRVK